MSQEGSRQSLPREDGKRSSDPASEFMSRIRSAELESLIRDIQEGMSLRTMDLMTDSSEDDLVKHLVREGRLGIEDVLEIVNSQGQIMGSKVLPHAEARYLEELAIAEALRSEKVPSWMTLEKTLSEGVVSEVGSEADFLADDTVSVSFEHTSDLTYAPDDEEEDSFTTTLKDMKKDEPMRYPKSVESLYQLIEPNREDEFNHQIDQFNIQLAHIQSLICQEHREREVKRLRRFILGKELILDSMTEAGILFLPGNFLDPITGRRLDNQDIPFILECVKDNKDLSGFNLAYNQITDEGLVALAEFIKDKPSVIHLNLSHNDFTVTGLNALVTCLINRPALHSFKITGVKIGDEGIDSITCLYMCGKGPRDLDVSETDMSMPGFQALCSALQAVDEDEDFPKFLTKHKLPFSLELLARLKVENHEFLKAQTYNRLCKSHFELVPPKEKAKPLEESDVEMNENMVEEENNQVKKSKSSSNDGLEETLENLFSVTFSAGHAPQECSLGVKKADLDPYAEQTHTCDDTDAFIEAHNFLRHAGCQAPRPDGRPVIVCPSLYSLDIDEFIEDEDPMQKNLALLGHKHVNPLYLDTLVERELDQPGRDLDKDVVDNITAEKATKKVVRDVMQAAGTIAGVTDYTHDSDITQLLLITILDTAKRFLEAEEDGGDLTEPELRTIWSHSVETSMKIFRPSIPAHCKVTDETLELFVEQFVKISNRTFYRLLQNPFLYELFEEAATRGCIETTKEEQRRSTGYSSDPLTYNCVIRVVRKFLEEIISQAGEIIGGGDPYNIRLRSVMPQTNDTTTQSQPNLWPSIADMTEDIVEPLVEKFFTAGVLLAQDALTRKEENETSQEEGIEPSIQFLEGIFDELANFLYQLKDDDRKLEESMGRSPKKFTFASKPTRLVLNRPIFNDYEPIMGSKLAAYLRNNESVKCLHLRKWGLGEDGLVNLMDGLMGNMNLVTLDLAGNGIGAEGMRPLGEYLKRNQNLRHLILNHNRLRNPGIQMITNSLRESSITSLNIAFNNATEIGLNPFLHTIRRSKIHSLYLLGNCFAQSSWLILKELVDFGILFKPECDFVLQEIDGLGVIVKNSQARDSNEWYEVPAVIDIGLTLPPFYMENYPPPKATVFGAVDVEI